MNSIKALAKKGSFGFAKRLLVLRAKPNVPFVRLAKRNLKNAKVGLFLSFLSPVPIAKHG